MPDHAMLKVEESDLCAAFGRFVAALLEEGGVDAVLVPCRQPFGHTVMQSLITSPDAVDAVDPLAPVAPTSSATLLSRLTRKGSGRRIAAFLRPCEVRAFLELTKLKQASLEDVLLIGMDCHGRYDTRDFLNYVGGAGCTSLEFLKAIGDGRGTEVTDGVDIIEPCRACVTPEAERVDLRVQVIGYRAEEAVGIKALSAIGEEMLGKLGLDAGDEPAEREAELAKFLDGRTAVKTALRAEYRDKVKDPDGLMEVLSSCINCYNCRVACPVCYCRECVFVTDTFGHEGQQYMGWAEKRGNLRMPTDTLFYHLTRMAHMGTLCVGCGQCTSACPNDIPVGQLFSMVGEGLQSVFDYVPGRDPDEEQPLAYFAEDELMEVTGQTK